MMTTNSIKKLILLVGCMTSSFMSVNADDAPVSTGLTAEMLRPDFSKLTPEAASLGKFGAFQVSEYSGAANISIPLHTVKSGDISFPISLYYDCSGIKVEQDATFVGLGWNLSYGGIINHITCGENDFMEDTGDSNPVFRQNWWTKKKSELKTRISSEPPFHIENYVTLRKNTNPYYIYQLPQNTAGSTVTGEGYEELKLYDRMAKGYDVPDVFQASFCGLNISFTIDKRMGKGANGHYPIIVLNNNPSKYKITYKTGSEDNFYYSAYEYPHSFIITDDKGINYLFTGYCENPQAKQVSGGYDSYYLTKIYGPDGENGRSVVKFEYEQIYSSFGPKSRIVGKNHQPSTKRIFRANDFIPAGAGSAFDNLMHPNVYFSEIASGESGRCDKVYPSKIITALETITFTKGERKDIPSAKCILGINVTSKSGTSTKKIKFAYDCFLEDSTKTQDYYSNRRLKLTDVAINDQKYKFEYDDRLLPSFASYSKDYWGYYNGANPNADKFVGCTPAYSISKDGIVRPVEHLDGSNRLASADLCNVGMLTKVIYPTGGYTKYEYEIHRFNDQYFYPDASHKANTSGATTYGSLSFCGTMTQTKKISKLSGQATLKIDINIYSMSKGDVVEVIVKDTSNTKVVGDTIEESGSQISKTINVALAANKDYIVEMRSKTAQKSSVSFAGSCNISSQIINPAINISPKPVNNNGGYSIGGGLRIKTIKNYDSNSTYLNGVRYEYSGGKLLSPTIQLETHSVDCNYDKSKSTGIHFSFKYANTEPSYMYICSLGIPATVGYDRVVKNEINEQGNITYRKTIVNFHNYGYNSSDYVNEINPFMQNFIYYPPYNGHLSGKIKNDSICNGSVLLSTTQYEYKSQGLDTIYYQKCLPCHIPIQGAVVDYNQGFFRKHNTWTYLTSKTSTIFDSNGKNPRTTTTSFTYNPSNYQVSEQKVCDSQNTSLTHYYYPLDKDNQSYGRSYLTDTHNISEVTAIDTYRNGTFVGGSRSHYTLDGSIPVVDNIYSILPDKDKTPILEMSVTAWDGYGNIREYRRKDDTPVVVVWSYNHQVPVLEIIGLPYSKLESGIKTTIEDIEKKEMTYTNDIENLYILLKRVKGIMVTACSYSPWQTVSRIIKPNGYGINYNYDSNGRLIDTRDAFGILQKYNYNYKNK